MSLGKQGKRVYTHRSGKEDVHRRGRRPRKRKKRVSTVMVYTFLFHVQHTLNSLYTLEYVYRSPLPNSSGQRFSSWQRSKAERKQASTCTQILTDLANKCRQTLFLGRRGLLDSRFAMSSSSDRSSPTCFLLSPAQDKHQEPLTMPSTTFIAPSFVLFQYHFSRLHAKRVVLSQRRVSASKRLLEGPF